MDTRSEESGRLSRRDFLAATGVAVAALGASPALRIAELLASPTARGAVRIGIIGAGRIGGAVGLEWAEAGHEVFFASRNPEELEPLVERGGSRTRAGTPAEAAAFGPVILVATPYDALPQVGSDHAAAMRGKVVICCSNPAPRNGGPPSVDALARGWGVVTPTLLPGVRLTRAFNAINFRAVESEAHRTGEKVGIPIVGDDADAVRVTSELVVDAGFDPVMVGGLDRASAFEIGSPVFVTNMTAAELREALGLR